jgi:hypothetical protein
MYDNEIQSITAKKYYQDDTHKYIVVCDRTLLNDDGTDATLFDQTEETQDAIQGILCG